MGDLAIRNVDDLARISGMVVQAGLFDCRDATQAGAKIMAGAELGLGPIASMQNIILVKGRPTLRAQTWAALIKKSGRYNYKYGEWTEQSCEIEFFEDGEPVGVSVFTIEDARKAGLGGDNWKKYPKAMLSARAMTQGARAYCPDVAVGGIYTPDEIDEEAEVVEVAEPVERASIAETANRVREAGGHVWDDDEVYYADERFFAQAVNAIQEKSSAAAERWAAIKDEAGYTSWDSVPAEKRPGIVAELQEVTS